MEYFILFFKILLLTPALSIREGRGKKSDPIILVSLRSFWDLDANFPKSLNDGVLRVATVNSSLNTEFSQSRDRNFSNAICDFLLLASDNVGQCKNRIE